MIQLKQLTIASWITIYRITIFRLVISLKGPYSPRIPGSSDFLSDWFKMKFDRRLIDKESADVKENSKIGHLTGIQLDFKNVRYPYGYLDELRKSTTWSLVVI